MSITSGATHEYLSDSVTILTCVTFRLSILLIAYVTTTSKLDRERFRPHLKPALFLVFGALNRKIEMKREGLTRGVPSKGRRVPNPAPRVTDGASPCCETIARCDGCIPFRFSVEAAASTTTKGRRGSRLCLVLRHEWSCVTGLKERNKATVPTKKGKI